MNLSLESLRCCGARSEYARSGIPSARVLAPCEHVPVLRARAGVGGAAAHLEAAAEREHRHELRTGDGAVDAVELVPEPTAGRGARARGLRSVYHPHWGPTIGSSGILFLIGVEGEVLPLSTSYPPGRQGGVLPAPPPSQILPPPPPPPRPPARASFTRYSEPVDYGMQLMSQAFRATPVPDVPVRVVARRQAGARARQAKQGLLLWPGLLGWRRKHTPVPRRDLLGKVFPSLQCRGGLLASRRLVLFDDGGLLMVRLQVLG